MLVRRSPGGGICYLESVPNTKSKAKAADNFRRNQECVQPTTCYSFTAINGGGPSSIPVYFVNGGMPSNIPICFINGGLV